MRVEKQLTFDFWFDDIVSLVTDPEEHRYIVLNIKIDKKTAKYKIRHAYEDPLWVTASEIKDAT